MNKFFSHSRPIVAICVLVLASVWLTVPRDICLTQALLDSGCNCTPTVVVEGPSCCTDSSHETSGNSKGCTGGAKTTDSGHVCNCLYVSSVLAKLSGAERLQSVAPAFDVVAVLPVVSVIQSQDFLARGAARAEVNLALNDLRVYRDNCVLLI